ncbi:phage tail protein [Streptomyces sp. NPDC059340]|uniref:phage tail protein n=1 Tax=Streptomyces sp. NPDC059340 TaxID=3346806 RepID=UPI00367DE5CC
MADDVTITVRVSDATGPGITAVTRRVDGLARSAKDGGGAFQDLRATMLSLAPAAVPVAAALAPIAVHAGAAGLAVAAFGAAVIPQIGNLKDAAGAQDKYTAAVTKYGAQSKQAMAAQRFVADSLSGMPAATQRASAAYSNLRDTFREFSDSSAKFTMAPVEKSFAVLGQIIPKLTPMARGASAQLDRLVTVAGGAVNTSGFDALSSRVSDFANKSLKNATDGAIHFMRVMSEGKSSGPIASFFAYAKAQGPAVKDLLTNVAKAVSNLLQGASQAGPGMLSLVNAFAKLVAAVPPSLVGNLMQVYAAFKLIKLAGAGIGVAAEGITSLRTAITGLTAASAAAGGGMAGLRAAFMSLGTAAKAGVIVAGIAAVALVFSKLSDMGKKAPPDVDKMTTALGNLARTGKVGGEAARSYGKDLSGLGDSLRTLARPSNLDKTQQFLTSLVGMDSTPVKKAKEDLDAVDKSLAALVKGGHADIAKAAFNDIAKAMEKQGMSGKELRSKMDDYKSGLADAALEAKFTAESQGLFGQAAQDTAAKLDSQKASADGLRGAIQALNDVQRQGLGGMIGFEAAIDAASKAAKDNAGALTMNHGVLDLNSEKARNAASALQDLADKTDGAATSARESGSSWETVNGIYARGRSELIKSAQAMGLSKDQAKALANQILRIPDKSAKVKMNTEDATRDLNSFNAAVKRTPGAKSVTLKTLSGGAEKVLSAFGFKVTHLKDGSVRVTAKTGGALSQIGSVSAAISNLNGKTATTYVITKTSTSNAGNVFHEGGHYARGGLVRRYADGGSIEGGSGTQDDVPLLAMGGEFIVNKRQTNKYRSLLEAINDDKVPHFAKGGLTSAEKTARSALSGQFGISHFGRMAGYHTTPFERSLGSPADLGSLTQALNEAAGQIRAAFSGRTERRLEKELDSVGKSLIKYDKSLYNVTRSLDSAKSKLDSLKSSASQLSDSVKSNVLSSSSITQGVSSGSTVTVASLMGGLTQSRDKASAFADALKGLKSKGLDKGLIQQIAEAGVNGGGLETAGALMGASSSEISSINSLQGQIGKAASSAGKTTADAVYGAAIKAQQKLVDSLKGQQAKLEKAMDHLAKVMEKALAKAVKGKASGGIVGAAASGGVRGGLTWVGEHEPELLDLPVGSRVWSGPDSRRMAASAGGGVARVEIEIRSSGSSEDELLLRQLRRAIRVRGGNVNVVLTGRP